FFAAIRDYYASFRDSSVLTNDFAAVVSHHANRPMDWFFEQWLLQPGYPRIEAEWGYRADLGTLVLDVRQAQPHEWGEFSFRLPVLVRLEGGGQELAVVRIGGREWSHRIPLAGVPAGIVLDPDGTLLLEILDLRRSR
ncbi:MAG: hypothetical protein V3T20_08280, partial [Gemmatimonadota bacterium]